MIQRQLPVWARAEHPVLRYLIGAHRTDERRTRIARWLTVSVAVVVIAVVGYAIGSEFFAVDPFERPISEALMMVLFWPLFVLQVGVSLSTLSLTVDVIDNERRRQTWDNLRTTVSGASLTIRARWGAVVFYRLRIPMILMTLARLLLIAVLLYDLTAFRGDYLSNLTLNIVPEVPLPLAVALLALMMTGSLLLPFTATGFDAAVGLFISTVVRKRVYVVIMQLLLIAFRVSLVFGLLLLVTQFRDGTLEATDVNVWLLLFAFAVTGDWGLSLLHLGYFGQYVWADVPYSILMGAALLVFVLVQTLLTDGLLAWAVRRAERRE